MNLEISNLIKYIENENGDVDLVSSTGMTLLHYAVFYECAWCPVDLGKALQFAMMQLPSPHWILNGSELIHGVFLGFLPTSDGILITS